MIDLDRLIKLMMMTTSNHDGEALTAMRMANADLSAAKLNWEEVLRGHGTRPQHQRRSAPRPPWETEVEWYTDAAVVEHLFEAAFRNASPNNPSFRAFLESLREWWDRKHGLTGPQYNALRRAAMNDYRRK